MIHEPIRELFEGSGLGLRRGSLVIADPDPSWAAIFESVATELEKIVPDEVVIEHVGSTSVAGLAAKPIIDVALGVPVGSNDRLVGAALMRAGFIDRGDIDDRHLDRMYGLELKPMVRLVNLHTVEFDGPKWRAYITFRDALRANDACRNAYSALKRDLASRHPGDRGAYRKDKEAFITSKPGDTGAE